MGEDKIIATYGYTDEAGGNLLYEVRRTMGKRFPVYHPRADGRMVSGMPRQRVLFNLPAVVAAKVVCVCEGLKKTLSE